MAQIGAIQRLYIGAIQNLHGELSILLTGRVLIYLDFRRPWIQSLVLTKQNKP